tara:strand:- start:1291 stop:1722 length:432 start_codon:yes stop_codon:yes gene_type:complete
MKINEVQIVYKRKNSLKPKFKDSNQVYKILYPFFENVIDHHESFKILLCDNNNRVLGIHQVSEGGLTGTVVDIRIIAQSIILSNAKSVILAHNHPSGNLEPSKQDKNVTNKIKNMCELLEVKLLDHIILTSDSYYSFADEFTL